jgi:hypothetical protein
MSISKTKNLDITYLSQNQTNKEILVNEGFLKFDSLMNNGAKSISVSTPPTSTEESDLYIIGASATGDWEGHENKFTYYHPSKGWVILEPNEGMTLWVNDEDKLYTFDGTDWVESGGSGDEIEKLGINTTADSTNKLSVKSDSVLFDNNGTDSQIKINKAGDTDTASHLLQTNYSGRAEFGLTGSDDFSIKVSADGSSWNNALTIDKSTAKVTFNEEADFSTNGAKFESGSFTPTIIGTTSTGSNSYSSNSGTYSLIGDRVFFELAIFLDGSSGALDSTGFMRIAGLPYMCSSSNCAVDIAFYEHANLISGVLSGRIDDDEIELRRMDNNEMDKISESNLSDNFFLRLSGIYPI